MSWEEVQKTIKRLEDVRRDLRTLFTGRDQAIELLVLAAVCHEHLLLIGPPGTAKTGIITRFCELVDAREFHYLLSRFTEPSELFGPLDLEAFQKGTYHIRTTGMLPEAQVAFLDEVFQGSSPILNSLLAIMNERVFHNGAVRETVPLASLIGASNSIPDDPWLRAFADRFILRIEVQPTPDDLIEDLLERGWMLESARIEALSRARGKLAVRVRIEDLLALNLRLTEINSSRVRAPYARLIRELRAEGVELSDRRVVKGLKLVHGAALLRGSDVATEQDFWPMLYVWGRPEEIEVLRNAVQPHLADDQQEKFTTVRSVSDILLDLETLRAQERNLTTEGALGAHLMAMNKLRRELINDHPSQTEPRRTIEEAIQNALRTLEESHV